MRGPAVRIIRGPREHGFTILPNAALEDARLSWRARGVLAYLLSRPDGWTTSAERLTPLGTEGRDAIRTSLRELEAAGYLTRTRTADAAGKWSTSVTVTDHPQGGDVPVHESTDGGFPVVGSPAVGSSAVSSKTETKIPPTPASGGASTACKTHKRPRRGCAPCATPAPERPTWCGSCDERTRTEEVDGRVRRCAHCHPLMVGASS